MANKRIEKKKTSKGKPGDIIVRGVGTGKKSAHEMKKTHAIEKEYKKHGMKALGVSKGKTPKITRNSHV